MNRTDIITALIVLTGVFSIKAQDQQYRIAFYNLENLFDTIADSSIRDLEYTPTGDRHWNAYRYREKSSRMAKAIRAIGQWEPPMIIGVAEIENKRVLEDLCSNPVLVKSSYDIIHFDSPDRRGIDVGMIYRKGFYFPLKSRPIPVKMPDDPDFTTRDILYSKGITHHGDTLHLFVCHWPSRYGGQQQSEPKRIRAAEVVRAIVDSIWSEQANANIIIMGDFNDEWNNKSLKDILKAGPLSSDSGQQLINLMSALPVAMGSHRYKGEWAYLDQIIISSNLMNSNMMRLESSGAEVCREPFLLERDEKFPGEKPFRTFLGFRYHGGFSDHLPVYIDLSFN